MAFLDILDIKYMLTFTHGGKGDKAKIAICTGFSGMVMALIDRFYGAAAGKNVQDQVCIVKTVVFWDGGVQVLMDKYICIAGARLQEGFQCIGIRQVCVRPIGISRGVMDSGLEITGIQKK